MMNVDTKIHYLQFQLPGNNVYADIAYISKSRIPQAGYGLFAPTNLPKNIPILIYMGRQVKSPNQNRQYIMEMPSTLVKKKTGDYKWESVRKGRKPKYLDALSSDSVQKWDFTKPSYLGAHLMNDPEFTSNNFNFSANCILNKKMEVYTVADISKDDELFINYNK